MSLVLNLYQAIYILKIIHTQFCNSTNHPTSPANTLSPGYSSSTIIELFVLTVMVSKCHYLY